MEQGKAQNRQGRRLVRSDVYMKDKTGKGENVCMFKRLYK